MPDEAGNREAGGRGVRQVWRYAQQHPGQTVMVLAVVFVVFLLGSWLGGRGGKPEAAGGRKILYYVDPMNPAHTSPEPGLAPCGMKMEPVFADQGGEDPGYLKTPGAVKVSPQKQQLLGVRLARVEKTPHTYQLRALGKVVVDERLTYRLTAAVEGWIREVGNNSTGAVVKQDETLAIIYSPEFLAPIQAYLYMLSSLDRFQATGQETPAQIQISKLNIQQYIESLRNLGMSDPQIKELEKTREYTESIRVIAPATSFILARNISAGQRFERGVELFRLADLSRVWVVADLYENEAGFIHPGEKVRVKYPYQRKVLEATVSDVLPQFDAISRTLKVRLETANADFLLRPDMFVDVEMPVNLPATVNVPVDAILDSGLKKTVFVYKGKGFFEPRQVETGWRLGDRVEVVAGLTPGEEIVVSGNFLIDSESRMRLAAAGLFGAVTRDPVCGLNVDESKAKAAGFQSTFNHQTYSFCSGQCKEKFDRNAERYGSKAAAGLPQESLGPDRDKTQAMTEPPKAPEALPSKALGGSGPATPRAAMPAVPTPTPPAPMAPVPRGATPMIPGPATPMVQGATPAMPAVPMAPMARPGATPAVPPAMPHGGGQVAPPVQPPQQQPQAPQAAPPAPQPASPVCPPGHGGHPHD